MRGSSTHGNQEIPALSAVLRKRRAGRGTHKGTPFTHGAGKSDRPRSYRRRFRTKGNLRRDRRAGAADAAPAAVPAAESTLGSHPCVALSSAQVSPEWTSSTRPCNDFSSNGDNPLTLVSHPRGSLQYRPTPPLTSGTRTLPEGSRCDSCSTGTRDSTSPRRRSVRAATDRTQSLRRRQSPDG